MARKETITKDAIIQAAFSILQEEGIEQVTARKLAAKANCSTQPIFRFYKSMDEVTAELADRSCQFFQDYYDQFQRQTVTPFVNLGLAYIRFSQEEQNLFRLLFLSENRHGKSLYDMLNGKNGAVVREINSAKIFGCKDPSGMFMKMWIFIHGAACMTLTGDYDLQEEDTIKLLEESYNAFQAI